MDKIRKEIINCNKCNLCKDRKNAVPGEGNIHSKIFFIGEAPGENEDREGIPFCGRSGKILDELLESINLKREDIFITNIVKCRPPQNRDPKEDEINACSPYLKIQIKLIDPILICTLGRYSTSLFLKDRKISQIHGKVFKYGKYKIIPLYHPAVGLYNPNMKSVLREDFQIIKTITTLQNI
jgi:DNA polymerase